MTTKSRENRNWEKRENCSGDGAENGTNDETPRRDFTPGGLSVNSGGGRKSAFGKRWSAAAARRRRRRRWEVGGESDALRNQFFLSFSIPLYGTYVYRWACVVQMRRVVWTLTRFNSEIRAGRTIKRNER